MDMNCGYLLYHCFLRRKSLFVYYSSPELKTDLYVAFLLTVPSPIKQLLVSWLSINVTPLRLHFASSVRIPHSVNNFRNLIPSIRTRGPRATIRSPEWHSHCRHADVMQHLSNPIITTNENIIIWTVLSFEDEYMGLTVNGAWSFE